MLRTFCANLIHQVEKPTKRLSNKQKKDRKRKVGKKFKHQRRQLRLARRTKAKKAERKEGLTYESGISTSLSSLQEEVTECLKQINDHDTREAESIANLKDFAPLPEETPDNSPSSPKVFYYDLETTSRSKDCEIVQIAVLRDEAVFERNVIPSSSPIAPSATAVHGITVSYNNSGKKCLMKNGAFLNCVNKKDAFSELLAFIRTQSNNGPCVLVGHNAAVFDTPRLIHQLDVCDLLEEVAAYDIYFSDSLKYIKKEIKLIYI